MNIGPYEMLSQLGQGGMGSVFLARSPGGARVAVKVLKGVGRDAETLARFSRERRLLGTLGEAEGFVPLLDAGEYPGGPYLVMPYLGHGTLRDRLRRGPLPVDEALAVASAVARAVARAHALGIVHRDVKPENILFADDGRPLVSDLGVAKHFLHDAPGASQSVPLSGSGEALGTFGYMSPEQMADSAKVGPPADVFALGALLYECASGVRPYSGSTRLDVQVAVLDGRHAPLDRIAPATPPWVARVVDRCLAPKPEDRFADAGELALALEPAARESHRRTAALTAALAVLAAALALAAAAVARRETPAPTARGPGATAPAASATRAAPSPAPSETPPSLPAVCAGFASSRQGTARLARVLGGYELKHPALVQSVAVSPDGTSALAGDHSGDVQVWDLRTGRERRTLVGHGHRAVALAFSGDGKLCASGSLDGSVRIWDVERGGCTRTLEAPIAVLAVAFVEDAGGLPAARTRRLLAGGAGGLRAWDVAASLDPILATEWPRGADVSTVALSLDGLRALAGRSDGSVFVWDVARSGSVFARGAHPGGVTAAAISPDRRLGLTAGKDGLVRVWDLERGEPLVAFAPHEGLVSALAFSPDGRRGLSAGHDRTLRVFDAATGVLALTLAGHASWLSCAAFAPDGRRAVSGGNDATVRVWDLDGGREALPPGAGHTGTVRGVGVSANGETVVSGGGDGFLRVWDVPAGRERFAHAAHEGPCESVALSCDGTRALTSGRDGPLRVFSLPAGDLLQSHEVEPGPVKAVLARDGRRALTLAPQGKARLLDVETGAAVAALTLHDGVASAFALSDDGRRALTGGADGTARVVDLESGLELSRFTAGSPVLAVAFAGTTGRGVCGLSNGGAAIFDLASGAELATLRGHEREVHAVAVARDGRRAFTASADRTVRLWDLPSASERDRIDLASARDLPLSVAVSDDGRSLVVGTARGVVLKLDLRASD